MSRFKPAQSGEAPFILGLSGPSRSGKTYSALRIAMGMVDGKVEDIFLGDTENGRAKQYVDRFGNFMHCNLEPPFKYSRYLELISDAVSEGAEIVIADSVSHAHEGVGGMLDQHDEELDRMAGNDWNKHNKMKFTAWIKPKAEMNKFIQAIIRLPVPVIFCFRAKEKTRMVTGKGGKQEPINIGLRAICSDELNYEMSSMLMLPENARGTPDLDHTGGGLREPFNKFIKPGVQLNEKLGKEFNEWIANNPKDKLSLIHI